MGLEGGDGEGEEEGLRLRFELRSQGGTEEEEEKKEEEKFPLCVKA